MTVDPITEFVFNPHALFEMAPRSLSEETICSILLSPEQRFEVRPGRDVLQSRVSLDNPTRQYLVRVFVDLNRRPAEVVTAYRRTKISKYWRE